MKHIKAISDVHWLKATVIMVKTDSCGEEREMRVC